MMIQTEQNASGLLLSNGNIPNILAKYRREGLRPLIAPKIILQAPLWQDPQFSARHMTMRRRYHDLANTGTKWVAELINVLPHDSSEPAPSWGLLRYLDLDVVMVFSLLWTLTGSRNVEMEQHELLRCMGYGDLTNAPYDELHASIRRLTHTKIAIFQEHTPKHLVEPWQIIDDSQRTAPNKIGNATTITARLSRLWEEALNSSTWQAVDLNAYAHLVRVSRRNGLARVVYLFLASWRDNKNAFDIPLFWIVDRFAQRLSDGRLRYPLLSHPRCLLKKSLELLQENQVIQITHALNGESLESARLIGRFLPVTLPQLPKISRQLVFLSPSLWRKNEICNLLPTTTETQLTNNILPTSPWAKAEEDYCEKTIWVLLDLFIPALARKRIKDARNRGWGIRQLWVAVCVVLWQWEEDESVLSPAAYLQKIITDGLDDELFRTNYSREYFSPNIPLSFDELKTWIAAGPLRDYPPPQKPVAKSNSLLETK